MSPCTPEFSTGWSKTVVSPVTGISAPTLSTYGNRLTGGQGFLLAVAAGLAVNLLIPVLRG